MATRLRADQRRARIVAAAREQFSEHGYEHTHVADIATAAGCTTGPMYHFFGTKRDVFRAALRACIRDAATSMTQMRTTENHTSALDRLVQSCDHLLELLSIKEVSTFTLEAPRVLDVDEYRDTYESPLLAFIETDLAEAMTNGEIQPEPLEPLTVQITGAVVASANHAATTIPHRRADKELAQHRDALKRMLQRLRIG